MKIIYPMQENNKNFTISYSGFAPTKEVESFLNLRIEKLLDIVPIHSNIALRLAYRNGKYLGKLSIFSLFNRFSSKNKSTNLEEAYNQLEKDILKQVNSWKKVRFHHQPTNLKEV